MLVPYGYGTQYVTLDRVRADLDVHHHPEFVRRFMAWLEYKGGTIGVGNGWRKTQPQKPGAAPEGKSFHQTQHFNDGFVGACAVDLVAPDGPDGNFSHDTVKWAAVLPQGTPQAKVWGLHCNVEDTEPWHMQPIEVDGYTSWLAAGRTAPRPGYPIPGSTVPVPPPDDLIKFAPPATPFPLRKDGLEDASRTRWLQQIMNERWDAALVVDGGFGKATDAAVRDMQDELDVTVDGVYGSQSAFALALFLSKAAA